ncbi:MAG: CBS domain-containing protein [Candidatus Bathyarchaeia archaeon]|jgi:CBS domain-containing protein
MQSSRKQEHKTVIQLDETPDVAKATVDTRESFCKMFEEAIDEAFYSLGEPTRKAIYIHLKNSFGIAKREIPYRINDFSDALEKIFGPAARNLEILCIKNIQAKARIDYKWDLPESSGSELTFEEYIRIVKQNYKQQESKQQESYQRAESKSSSAEKKRVTSIAQEKTDEDKVALKTVNVMVKTVITVDEKASVKEAADIMNQFEIGSVITTRKGKPIGIITERDLLKRIVSEGRNAKKTTVKEIMSSPLVVVSTNTDLEEAARLMFEMKIKKLPVTEQNRLVGLVSLTDIARAQPMIKFLQKLAATQYTPKSMQKVLNCYIV